ncbi:hypothetical protein BpHYR1_008457 [Brachionus plicatilis]|uniref:Uncharacterized protein n=1 Tax=Brachionus plicatilis TaxID=10195 RepID=A0A3M7QJY1_BRAPC|nr:hypothetical protein BpHYR1_008457 [Brachionus plicatilis]
MLNSDPYFALLTDLIKDYQIITLFISQVSRTKEVKIRFKYNSKKSMTLFYVNLCNKICQKSALSANFIFKLLKKDFNLTNVEIEDLTESIYNLLKD